MNSKILLFLALVAVAFADKRPSYFYDAPQSMEEESVEESDPPKYEYLYGIKDEYSGIDFAHSESRDEDETRGSYSVQLPDGRLQKVTYYVDGDSGYVAEVTYEGEAHFPESEEKEEEEEESQEAPRVYAPPRRSYGFPQ